MHGFLHHRCMNVCVCTIYIKVPWIKIAVLTNQLPLTQVPSPIGKGWKMAREDQSEQVVHWMEGQPAPDDVLDQIYLPVTVKNVRSQNVCVYGKWP